MNAICIKMFWATIIFIKMKFFFLPLNTSSVFYFSSKMFSSTGSSSMADKSRRAWMEDSWCLPHVADCLPTFCSIPDPPLASLSVRVAHAQWVLTLQGAQPCVPSPKLLGCDLLPPLVSPLAHLTPTTLQWQNIVFYLCTNAQILFTIVVCLPPLPLGTWLFVLNTWLRLRPLQQECDSFPHIWCHSLTSLLQYVLWHLPL